MRSIHSRLLIASSLVLAGFLGITGFALDRAFRDSAATAAEEKLQSRIYALLAAADADAQGRLLLPEHLPERRLSEPDSGLYAMVIASDANLFWQSASLAGRSIHISSQQAPGNRNFRTLEIGDSQLLALDYGVSWEDDTGAEQQFTFVIAEDMQPMQAELERFRQSLWRWLGGLALVLLMAQGWILRWGLHPLRGVAADLQKIRQGAAGELKGDYPRELRGLTSSLNELLAHASSVRQRYRNSLDDLAHSLKTPLAFLRSVAEDQHKDCEHLRQVASEQVERMDTIVHTQLQRAAASGRITLAKPVAVEPVVRRLVKSLDKIYQHKGLATELRLEPGVTFSGDEEDLMEVLGNLLENAFKFAESSISVTAEQGPGELLLSIGDDGPGIPAQQMEQVLRRGGRADQALPVPGQGIGLAVVDEIVSLYHGSLEISASEIGGARLLLRFPVG